MQQIDMESNQELEASVQRTVEMQRIDPNYDPVEDALKRCPWCLLVPTDCPDDPNIIGPFDSFEEAETWSRSYPYSFARLLVSPEVEILIRRESEEIEALERPRTDPSTLAVQDSAASCSRIGPNSVQLARRWMVRASPVRMGWFGPTPHGGMKPCGHP